jgi:hypothetical protein
MSTDMDERARQVLPPRFWAKVVEGPLPAYRPDLGQCWLWTGYLTNRSYGTTWNGHHTVLTHRWALEAGLGKPLTRGLHADHLCRRTPCVRPSHLEQVTPGENVARSETFGARAVRSNRCRHGHEFTPENTYFRPHRPGRICRACAASRARGYRKQAIQKAGI